MKKWLLGIGLILINLLVHADEHLAMADGPRAYIISPVDGAEVTQTFKVVFGLSQMGIAPAGTEKENTGHHHLLIDVAQLPDLTKPLGKSDQIRHFGGGQTEAVITLPKGKHTLQLVLGNHAHVPHQQPVISEKISIMVK